jgi:uncharacterized protein (TIGR00251 family)
MSFLKEQGGRILLFVHAQPKASRNAIVGRHGDRLKIAVQTPPVDGAANDALMEFLADRLNLAKRDIELVSGATGRQKTFSLKSISLESARQKLEIP